MTKEPPPKKERFDTNLWILPYANLMTIIMIFFLIMYIFATFANKITYERMLLQVEKSLGTDISEKERIVDAAGKIESYINERGLGQLANVEINAQKIKIVMAAPIVFASGSADVSREAEPLMDVLTHILTQIPNRVIVEGHTDDLPLGAASRYRSNLELSGARAFSFIKYVMQKGNLPPDRFVAIGCGENIPLRPNDSPGNRAMNRRVEISIEK